MLGDIEGFAQLMPGTYKSVRPINFVGIHKSQRKSDCINGPIVSGIWEPILYKYALDKPPGHKVHKQPRMKLFRKIIKSVLYIKGNGQKPVNFNGETLSFSCQLIKKIKKTNLNMIQPKNEIKVLLLSITENCETLLKETHKRAEET